jgi:ABC-type lipoprotein export system ATPase subunit
MVTHAPDLAAKAQRRLHVLDGRMIDPMERRRDGAPSFAPTGES